MEPKLARGRKDAVKKVIILLLCSCGVKGDILKTQIEFGYSATIVSVLGPSEKSSTGDREK